VRGTDELALEADPTPDLALEISQTSVYSKEFDELVVGEYCGLAWQWQNWYSGVEVY
jgi:hypothetical protein